MYAHTALLRLINSENVNTTCIHIFKKKWKQGRKKDNVIGKKKRKKLGRGNISKKSQHMEGIRKEKKYFQKCEGGGGYTVHLCMVSVLNI